MSPETYFIISQIWCATAAVHRSAFSLAFSVLWFALYVLNK